MRTVLVTSLAAVASLAAPDPAAACILARNLPIVIDGPEGDLVAPTAPVVHDAQARWVESSGDCEERGVISLALTARDDRTPPDALGYQLVLRSGVFPGRLPAEAVRSEFGGDSLAFFFDHDTSSVDFELEVRAVDRTGNRSEPTVVAVRDEAGCAAGGGGALAPALVALGFVIARRRTRR